MRLGRLFRVVVSVVLFVRVAEALLNKASAFRSRILFKPSALNLMPPKVGPGVFAPKPKRGDEAKSAEQLLAEYEARHTLSLANPEAFWREEALKYVDWFAPFRPNVKGGGFEEGDVNWFSGGKLNACYNCVDRHAQSTPDKVAIIWEGDEPGTTRKITYAELQREVCRIANVMTSNGVRRGDVVTIYMPMVPELAMVMLACARIGAVHSIVFAGFSSESLRGRIEDCRSKYVFTSDEGRRGGKALKLKDTVDGALKDCPSVTHCFVFKRAGETEPAPGVKMVVGRDHWIDELMLRARPHAPVEWLDAEDPLFILYTSGSTGKPKGVAHTTGGYLVNAALTTSSSFDIQEGDVYCCVADCGWITGHTYVVYGPLCLGTTTCMFESVPTYPNPYRYWDMVQRLKVTQFYTAPTAIRALMRYDEKPIKDYDLSSLRVLGSVGEPINPEAWRWYDENVGQGRASIVDTYWQTETGGHIATNLPGIMAMKPGSCALPYYGIEFAVLDPASGKELVGANVEGVLCIKSPWPSMARTVYGDHDRFLNVYTRPYPGELTALSLLSSSLLSSSLLSSLVVRFACLFPGLW